LTMSEDEGQEDRVIDKLLGEAVKNIFEAHFDPKHFKALVEWFESGKTFIAGDRVPSAEYVRRVNEGPVLKREVGQFLKKVAAEGLPEAAHDALTASVAEFILEGLHVENRLNRNVKSGEITFKR